MDAIDAFDELHGTYTKTHALLKAALDYEELNGPDDVVMTLIEISLDLIQSSRNAWDILERDVCRPTRKEPV